MAVVTVLLWDWPSPKLLYSASLNCEWGEESSETSLQRSQSYCETPPSWPNSSQPHITAHRSQQVQGSHTHTTAASRRRSNNLSVVQASMEMGRGAFKSWEVRIIRWAWEAPMQKSGYRSGLPSLYIGVKDTTQARQAEDFRGGKFSTGLGVQKQILWCPWENAPFLSFPRFFSPHSPELF